jgi:hypothetical protein
MWRQLGPNPRQIENAGNGAHQVIVRHDLFEIKRMGLRGIEWVIFGLKAR